MQPTVLQIATGTDQGLIDQLIQKSNQENILKFTPKDSTQRFADTAAFNAWLGKGREIHWLLGPDDDLAGIIWYGKSAFPSDLALPETPDETFAIRLYEGYVGHGLAKPFMTQSLAIYAQQKQALHEQLPSIWLETNLDNPAARAAYTKFGYQEVASNEKRVTMVLPTATVRAIIEKNIK